MPDLRPDLAGVRAVAVTTCPLLAAHLAGLHPAVATALLTRLAGIGTLRDVDALLLLTRHDPDDHTAGPAGNGLVTETLYIGTNLDDADVWARAVKLRAAEVLFAPGDDDKITTRLVQHLGGARMTTARHPNRTGLRTTTASTTATDAAAGTSVLVCRCPARVVSGTVWAYDNQLGWHDPTEHDTWTPPRRPTRAPLPAALRDWTASTRPEGSTTRPPATDRRHTLAPAGHGLVVCTACGLCFDAGACTRSGRPLPACQPPVGGEVSVPGPTVLSYGSGGTHDSPRPQPSSVDAWRARQAELLAEAVRVLTAAARLPRPVLERVDAQAGPGGASFFESGQVEQGGIAATIAARPDPDERHLLYRYGTWYLARRLRARSRDATSYHQVVAVRQRLRFAIAFLDALADRRLTLATAAQPDLEAWLTSDAATGRHELGEFIRWASANKLTALTLPSTTWAGPATAIQAQERWDQARRLLHDQTLDAADRLAGLLVLLYAQRAASIARLSLGHLDLTPGAVRLRLGPEPLALPAPLDHLAVTLAATSRGHRAIGDRGPSPWLFPGRRPGQPISAYQLGKRLKQLGIRPWQARNAALFDLAMDLPAALLARLLGINVDVAATWQRVTAGDWTTYAADIAQRQEPGSRDTGPVLHDRTWHHPPS